MGTAAIIGCTHNIFAHYRKNGKHIDNYLCVVYNHT